MVLEKGKAIVLKEHVREDTSDPLVVVRKVRDRKITKASKISQFLCRVKSFWLFDWFPDELILEEKRIVLKHRYFPFFTSINTIALNRVTVFEVIHSIFFSSIHVRGSYGDGIDDTFRWLRHSQAQEMKEVVDGLRLRESESIEIENDDRLVMLKTLSLIGGGY